MRSKVWRRACAAAVVASLGGCASSQPEKVAEPAGQTAQPAGNAANLNAKPQPTPGDPIGAGGTDVLGEIPASLAGTWLVVQQTQQADRYLNGWEVFRITHEGKTWDLKQFIGPKPPFEETLKSANQAGTPFEPSSAEVSAVTGFLPSLSEPKSAEAPHKIVFRDNKNLPPVTVPRPEIEAAKIWVEILSREKGSALTGLTFYLKSIDKNTVRGDWLFTSLVNLQRAGLVPTSASGPFVWYRVKE